MATIVNNPQPQPQPTNASSNGNSFLVGVILLILAAFLFFYYVVPYISTGFGGTQVNVPDKINVNVQQQPQK